MEDVHKALLAAALSQLVPAGQTREIGGFDVTRSGDGRTISVMTRKQYTLVSLAVHADAIEARAQQVDSEPVEMERQR